MKYASEGCLAVRARVATHERRERFTDRRLDRCDKSDREDEHDEGGDGHGRPRQLPGKPTYSGRIARPSGIHYSLGRSAETDSRALQVLQPSGCGAH